MAALVVLAIIAGALLGAVNGILVWKLAIPPIVVTLGTLTIFRGLIFVISDGQSDAEAINDILQLSTDFADFKSRMNTAYGS